MEINNMKKLICPCCGAPINREKRKCEYCGVEFEIEEDKIVKIASFYNPVKEFTACAVVPREKIVHYGQAYMEHTIRELAQAMLPAVMEGMHIQI